MKCPHCGNGLEIVKKELQASQVPDKNEERTCTNCENSINGFMCDETDCLLPVMRKWTPCVPVEEKKSVEEVQCVESDREFLNEQLKGIHTSIYRVIKRVEKLEELISKEGEK